MISRERVVVVGGCGRRKEGRGRRGGGATPSNPHASALLAEARADFSKFGGKAGESESMEEQFERENMDAAVRKGPSVVASLTRVPLLSTPRRAR